MLEDGRPCGESVRHRRGIRLRSARFLDPRPPEGLRQRCCAAATGLSSSRVLADARGRKSTSGGFDAVQQVSPRHPHAEPLPASCLLIGPAAAPALHVMSWNIRRRVRHFIPRAVDRWDHRTPALKGLLQAERPTLLGVQEALPDQAHFVGDALGVGYRRVGHGRAAGGHEEGCPIYYDVERLELLDWEQLALSNRPTHPGSTSWGNILPRILVSATFRDRATSRHFLALNTHLDHLSAGSRLRSARAILAVASQAAMPTVLMGDLNDNSTSAPLRELLAGGLLADTWGMAQRHVTEEWGTFANYKTPRRGRNRLDWILASADFRVDRAAINPQRYAGAWASDHLPVQAVLVLP